MGLSSDSLDILNPDPDRPAAHILQRASLPALVLSQRGSGSALKTLGNVEVVGALTVSGEPAIGNYLNFPTPADVGLIAWTYDGAYQSAGAATADGTVYLLGLYLRQQVTISNLWFGVTTAGTSLTAGQNWAGLYNSAGTKLADAALDSVINTTGTKTVAITPQVCPAGLYWVALLTNGTGTDPSFASANANAAVRATMPNGAASAATLRNAVNGTSQTTLPSSITPASNTSTGSFPIWAAVS
jgi:hypothetical protein